MIEVGRSEQMIKEMDKLASEDHTYKASREEIEFYRGNWWIHTNVAHSDSVPTRYEPEFKNALSTMHRLKQAEDEKQGTGYVRFDEGPLAPPSCPYVCKGNVSCTSLFTNILRYTKWLRQTAYIFTHNT